MDRAPILTTRLRYAGAFSLLLVGACGRGNASSELTFPDRVAPPLKADSNRDITVRPKDCGSTEAELRKRWGIPRTTGVLEPVLRWADRRTTWVADMIRGADTCELRFSTSRFFGSPGTPPPSLAKIHSGMSKSEAQQIAPSIADATTAPDLPEIAGGLQAIAFDPRTNRVVDTYVVLPDRAFEALVMAWGRGPMWLDEATTTRARLVDQDADHAVIRFQQYVPLARWLGDGGLIAALPSEIWTFDLNELAAKYPNVVRDREPPYALWFPPTEVSPYDGTSVDLQLDGTKHVQKISLALNADSPQMRERVLLALEHTWGRRKQLDASSYTFANAANVTVKEQLGSLLVYVTRPQ